MPCHCTNLVGDDNGQEMESCLLDCQFWSGCTPSSAVSSTVCQYVASICAAMSKHKRSGECNVLVHLDLQVNILCLPIGNLLRASASSLKKHSARLCTVCKVAGHHH